MKNTTERGGHGDGKVVSASRKAIARQPQAGDVVLIRWDPTTTRVARFVRYNGAGNPVLQVERVAADGSRVVGQYGTARCFGRDDILGPV